VLALGLGIGANTAIFCVVYGVLLQPLPFPQSSRLVNVWESDEKRNLPKLVGAPANYYDWRTMNTGFSAIGAYQQNNFNLLGAAEPDPFPGAICDLGFFAALGVAPMVGRTFNESDSQPGQDEVVLLGYGLWKTRFGDASVLGKTLELNG
jgi:hypothetical protein